MRTTALLFVLTILVAVTALSGCRGDAAWSPQRVEEWRAERLAALNDEDGWLSVVGLHWLDDGPIAVGFGPAVGAEGARIELLPPARPEKDLPALLATLEVSGLRAEVVPTPGAGLRVAGEQVDRAELEADQDGEPTLMTWGPLKLHLIERGGALALRVKDSSLPAERPVVAIPAYPISADWVLEGRFEPFDEPRSVGVPNITGREYDQRVPGEIVFTLDGEERRLLALDNGPESLLLVVGDRTNGDGTYGGGRYLAVSRPAAGGGAVELDLNLLYNPPCVFTAFATCPLPPRQNRISSAVEAGERYPDLPWMHVESS